jgi:hypothetical protein
VSDRKPFLLRIDRTVLDALQRWANDDLRSLNGQIEFVLRRALREAGRESQRPAGEPAPEVPAPPDEPQRPRKSDRSTE